VSRFVGCTSRVLSAVSLLSPSSLSCLFTPQVMPGSHTLFWLVFLYCMSRHSYLPCTMRSIVVLPTSIPSRNAIFRFAPLAFSMYPLRSKLRYKLRITEIANSVSPPRQIVKIRQLHLSPSVATLLSRARVLSLLALALLPAACSLQPALPLRACALVRACVYLCVVCESVRSVVRPRSCSTLSIGLQTCPHDCPGAALSWIDSTLSALH